MKEESRERETKRCNIVIKGATWRVDNIKQAVEDFIKDEVKAEVKVRTARKLKIKESEEMVMAEIEKLEMKKEVMSKKQNLKRELYIDDGLTKEERVVPSRLSE
ncbi:hypothetical protein K0M31_001931 [Melipona bicolor]|uniref:Uncharacterized protein n=1 Tax=Melipona bicolor TaxID=60889 RepID=A0AA40KYC4_9HYME|nr:hypothetical protein K0M31_001931 [Melipona bicolor]